MYGVWFVEVGFGVGVVYEDCVIGSGYGLEYLVVEVGGRNFYILLVDVVGGIVFG